MAVYNLLCDFFGPGGPGFAVTLFVLLTAASTVAKIRFEAKGQLRQANKLARRGKYLAVGASAAYLIVWLFFYLRSWLLGY